MLSTKSASRLGVHFGAEEVRTACGSGRVSRLRNEDCGLKDDPPATAGGSDMRYLCVSAVSFPLLALDAFSSVGFLDMSLAIFHAANASRLR
jgi:hypothetical protein